MPGGERTGTVAPAVVEAAQADGPSVADAGAPGSQAGGATITIAEAPEARPAPGTAEDSDIGGALWGSLVHGLLEHAVRHTGAGRADLDRLARWLTVETPDLRPFVPAALDLVDDLRRAPLWAELREAREVHVEVPFAIRLEGGERLGSGEPVTQPTIVRGVIDLVYAASDETGWRLLDYKTDRQAHFANGNVEAGTDAALLQRHVAQLEQYNAAWERVTTMPVTRQGIVAVRSKRTVWIGGTQPA